MRSHHAQRKLWMVAGVVAVAAVAAAGAVGGSVGGTITTIAGGGVRGVGDGGPATSARLAPSGVAVDRQGNVYIADSTNNRIRKVSKATITTIAGVGKPGVWGPSGDGGPATSANLGGPEGVAVDRNGNVYIADTHNNRVRKIDRAGTITTIAGTGKPGASGDGGLAISAQLWLPRGVALDSEANLYIADTHNNRVRKVDRRGMITTIAGTGQWGLSGDGGPATSAELSLTVGVAVDGRGNVYIADFENDRVRKVDRGGTITTIAGTEEGFSGDGGPAVSARLWRPDAVAVDIQGNVYIADRYNQRVRKVVPSGTITTIAGTGKPGIGGFSGDGGMATAASLSFPAGVAVDERGNVYIADQRNNRVRKVTLGAQAATLTLRLGGSSPQRLLAQKGITVTARCGNPCSLSATGSVTIVGTRTAFGLTRATARLAAGTRTLTLRFPAAEQKRFRELIKPGQQARATITVRAADKAGNTSRSTRTVAVRL